MSSSRPPDIGVTTPLHAQPGPSARSAPPGNRNGAPAGSHPVASAGPTGGRRFRMPRPSGWVVGPTKAVMWLGGGAIFLSISRLHQHFTILGRAKAPFFLATAALILLALSLDRWKPGDLMKQWMAVGILVIAAFAFMSAPFGISVGASAAYLNEMYSRMLMITLIAWAIGRSPDGVRFLARVYMSACLTAVVLAFVTGRTDSAGRLSGAASYDPNDLALVAVVALPLAAWYLFDKTNKWRLPVLLALPLCVTVIVRSDSRSGFLGLAAVVLGMMYMSRKNLPKRVKRASAFLSLAAVLSIPFMPSDYLDRIQSINDEGDYNRTSETGRNAIWKRGIGYAMDRPLFGVGVGNFSRAEGTISPLLENRAPDHGLKWSAAHNSFVQVIAELGFIGGGVFVVLVLGGMVQLIRTVGQKHQRDGPAPDLLAPFLGLSFLGFAVTGFFLSFGYHDLTYVLFALGANLLYHARRGWLPTAVAKSYANGRRRHG